MRPILEKLMMVGFMAAGLCTGTFLFGGIPNKTMEELLAEDEMPVLNTKAEKDSAEYKEWEKLVKGLADNESERLSEFLGETIENPGYETTVKKLQDRCGDLLTRKGSRGSQYYDDAVSFCTEYEEIDEDEAEYQIAT